MAARNDEERRRNAAYFQRKNDPAFAFGQAVAMLQLFPGLVGIWPCSIPDSSANVRDISGNALTMTNTGTALFSADSDKLAPYIELNGSSQYLTRPDEALLSVTGTESYIAAAINGLTLGGYFWADAVVSTQAFMSKANGSTAAGSSFSLFVSGAAAVFEIFNSTNQMSITSTNLMAAGRWHSIVARFTPSAELKIWLDGVSLADTNSVFASLNDTAAAFQIGAINGGTLLNGRASLCFLCAAAVPNPAIETFIGYTRPMYGV